MALALNIIRENTASRSKPNTQKIHYIEYFKRWVIGQHYPTNISKYTSEKFSLSGLGREIHGNIYIYIYNSKSRIPILCNTCGY